MKKRYSIWVRENGAKHDVELCQLDGNPQATVTALYAKRLKFVVDRKIKKIAKYDYVRVVDNDAAD